MTVTTPMSGRGARRPCAVHSALVATAVLLGAACAGGSRGDEVATGPAPETSTVPDGVSTSSAVLVTTTSTEVANRSGTRVPGPTTTRPPSAPPDDGPVTTVSTPSPTVAPPPSTTIRPRPGPPPSGPYNSDFVAGPGPAKWFPRLQGLDPQQCASLIPEITDTMKYGFPSDPGDQFYPLQVARFVFRGAARGCAGDLAGSRADLACAVKHRALSNATTGRFRFDVRDEGSALVLDWAIQAFGPVTAPCVDG